MRTTPVRVSKICGPCSRVMGTGESLRALPKVPTTDVRLSEKFFVANVATAAATHSSRQDSAGTRSPKNRRLGPFSNLLSGQHEGENVGGPATIERRKCSRKRWWAMADRSDATNPTRKEPSP